MCVNVDMIGVEYVMCCSGVCRYRDFVLVLCEVFVVRGDSSLALLLSSQTSRLLDISTFIHSLSPPTPTPEASCHANLKNHLSQLEVSCHCDSNSHLCHKIKLVTLACRIALLDKGSHKTNHVTCLMSALLTADKILQKVGVEAAQSKGRGRGRRKGGSRQGVGGGGGCDVDCVREVDCVRAEVACERAECHLLLWQPDAARHVVTEALDRLEHLAGKPRSCTHHHLHRLTLARLHFLNGQSFTQIINGKHQAIAGREVWSSRGHVRDDNVQRCVEEFMSCFELCFPVRPAVLLREVCLWLSFLSPLPDHSHHYLSLAQQVSLTHKTIIVLGKKIR